MLSRVCSVSASSVRQDLASLNSTTDSIAAPDPYAPYHSANTAVSPLHLQAQGSTTQNHLTAGNILYPHIPFDSMQQNRGVANNIGTLNNMDVLQRLKDAKRSEIVDLQTEHAITTMRLNNAQEDLRIIERRLCEVMGE